MNIITILKNIDLQKMLILMFVIVLLLYVIFSISQIFETIKYRKTIKTLFPINEHENLIDINTIKKIVFWKLSECNYGEFKMNLPCKDMCYMKDLRRINKTLNENKFLSQNDIVKLNKIFSH